MPEEKKRVSLIKGITIYSFKCQMNSKYLDLGERTGLQLNLFCMDSWTIISRCVSNHVREKDQHGSINISPIWGLWAAWALSRITLGVRSNTSHGRNSGAVVTLIRNSITVSLHLNRNANVILNDYILSLIRSDHFFLPKVSFSWGRLTNHLSGSQRCRPCSLGMKSHCAGKSTFLWIIWNIS